MRIGIDARPLQAETRFRGIGKALGFFLEAFADCVEAEDKIIFYIDPGLPTPDTLKLFKNSVTKHTESTPIGRMRYIRSVLPQFAPVKPKASDIDVLLQYDGSLGVPRSVPTVCMFHDLIPYLFRGQEKQMTAGGLRKYKNKLAGSLYWQKYLRTLRLYKKAAHILAISESSKRDLLKFDRSITSDRVDVAYLGSRPHVSAKGGGSKVRELTKNPYLLYVGGIDLRKNVTGLLEAFYEAKSTHPDLRLICVGKEFELQSQLGDLGWNDVLHSNSKYAKDVINPGFVDEPSLTYLYEHASAFVFPSRYEGFGLPAIEAMQASCPVIAYNNSSIPEIVGDAALLLPDGSSLTPAINRILSEQGLRKQLIAKGVKQAKLFTWKKTAEQTLAVLRETANKA